LRSSTDASLAGAQRSPADIGPLKHNANTRASNNLLQQPGFFNVCPKLDEVAIIEPLICKRICRHVGSA